MRRELVSQGKGMHNEIISTTTESKRWLTMIIRAMVWSLPSESLESIQIELPLERSQLMLIEVRWHVLLNKFLGLFDDEASAVRHPAHDILMAVLFHIPQYLVQLGGERMLYAAPGPDPIGSLLHMGPLSICGAAPSGNAATRARLLGFIRFHHIPGR